MLLRSLVRNAERVGAERRSLATAVAQRASPSPSARASSSSTTTYIPERLRAKNAVRALSDVLPRILEVETLAAESWNERLSSAVDLLSLESRKPTVAVWGVNPSTSRDLVTALLEDPLSSDDTRRTLLATRWEHRDDDTLNISYAPQTSPSSPDPELRLPSSWLHNAEAHIVEISCRDPQQVINHFFQSDFKLLVIESPADLLREDVKAIVQNVAQTGSLTIVANDTAYQSALSRRALGALFSQALERSIGSGGTQLKTDIHLYLTSSEAAIDSQAAFRRDQLQEALQPSSSTSNGSTYAAAVSRFQVSLQNSGLPQLSQALLKSLSAFRDPKTTPPPSIRSSLGVATAAVHRSYESLKDAQHEVVETEATVAKLRSEGKNFAKRFADTLFRDGDLVSSSTKESRLTVERYLEGMKWWKLPWRVDELTAEISSILHSSYGRKLERELVYRTGFLAAFQESQNAAALRAITPPKPSYFHSPLLLNSLEQLTPLSSRLSPTSLLAPTSKRLAQMTAKAGSPLAHLHLRAQILLLQAYGLGVGGPGAAWAAWASGYTGEEIAVGAGVLSAALGVRWGVGRWERAKRRWWESWARVDEGLERDLQVQVDSVIRDVVLVKSTRAAEGLEHLIEQRKENIKELSSQLESIARDVAALQTPASGTPTNTA